LCCQDTFRARRSAAIRDRLRINNRIRAREVRVIDEEGGQVGILSVRDALALAEERGLDLVEVAPNAVPPVCRLLDYGKFRYEQSKKEREAHRNQKQIEIKELRLRPKTDDHDMLVKQNQARKFLLHGDKVKFTVRFRGREMAYPDIGREMLEQLAENLRDIALVEQRPQMEGRALSLVLAPNKATAAAAAKARLEQPRVERGPDPAQSANVSQAEPEDEDDEDEDDDAEDEDA
jgi:translation initiation factor IF-3